MLVLAVEHFKNGSTRIIHRRFRSAGRLLPQGVTYVCSWIDPDGERCFQIVETPDIPTLQPWIDAWSDVIDFEITPVVTPESFWKAFEDPI